MCLCKFLELFYCVCYNEHSCIVCKCIHFCVRYCAVNVVDVEVEEAGGEGTALRDAALYCLFVRLRVLRMDGLEAVLEVGGEEGGGGGGEVVFISEFRNEFVVRDCVVGFRQIDIHCENKSTVADLLIDEVGNRLECENGA